MAMVLAGALMAGLWGILSLNMRTFEAGRAKTERAQLTRALAERIEDDLRSLAPLADELRLTQQRLDSRGSSAFALGSEPLPTASVAPTTPAAPADSVLTGPPVALDPTTQLALGSATGVAPPTDLPSSSAVESPPISGAASATTYVPARVYSLVGSSHALQLRVLTSVADVDALPATSATGELTTPLPRDLQVVEYYLEQPQAAPQSMEDGALSTGPAWRGAGLLRRQRTWTIAAVSPDSPNTSTDTLASEDPLAQPYGSAITGSQAELGNTGAASSLGSTATGSSVGSESSDPLASTYSTQSLEPLPAGLRAQQLFVPEVTGWQLRYYDGVQWHAQWHSGRKGLPTAIEVQLSLRAAEPPGRRRPRTAAAAGSTVSANDTAESTTAFDSLTEPVSPDETMRLVVCLPFAIGPASARESTESPGTSSSEWPAADGAGTNSYAPPPMPLGPGGTP